MRNSSDGRTKGIIICVSGMTGSGKSTLGKRIAEKYGLEYRSGGDALKALALEEGYEPAEKGWWETAEGTKFLRRRIKDADFDKKVDQKLMAWARRRGDVVLDSWTMPWLLDEGVKVWLEASGDVRAKRLAERNAIDLEKALEVMKEKDERTKSIYKDLYGFNLGEDFSPFDLILDTDLLDADEVFRAVCLVLDRLVQSKRSEFARS